MSLHEMLQMEWKALADELRRLDAAMLDGKETLSLAFSVKSGFPRGDHLEYENVLTLAGQSKGTLFRRRDGGDTCQETPGLFHGEVPPEELDKFLDAVKGGDFSFRKLEELEPGSTSFGLEVAISGRVFRWTFGIPEIDACEGFQTVLAFLYDWGARYFNQPIWSMHLAVENLNASRNHIEANLRLSNQGEREIAVVHPDRSGNSAISYIFFQYGEKQQLVPGVTPLPMELTRIKLDFQPLDRMEIVSIPPAGTLNLKVSQRLDVPLPENWLGSFCLYSYAFKDALAGQELFSGAVFSPEVEG